MVLFNWLHDKNKSKQRGRRGGGLSGGGGEKKKMWKIIHQSKYPIIKITFYICLKKRLQNIKLNNLEYKGTHLHSVYNEKQLIKAW